MAVSKLLRGATVLFIAAAPSCCPSELGCSRSSISSRPLQCWRWSISDKKAFKAGSGALRCALLENIDMDLGHEASTPRANDALPELQTEFMVDMKCEGCVNSVRSKLEGLVGVKSVDVDLANQLVKVYGSASLKSLTTALEQSGRKARLVGQGFSERFAISAAVAEFKGPEIYGVVRFGQVSLDQARFEASFSGLSPGPHRLSINMFGDLRGGAATTGPVYNPTKSREQPLGDLGAIGVKENGEADLTGTKSGLTVGDLIGRALVVYQDQDKSKEGIAAAVIARSAGVGENHKKLCTCDGTVIWESNNIIM